MVDEPIERQKYKLLPPSEHQYVELSSEKLKEYNPNTTLQYNNRIRYRTINAIKEIAWLCDKLPEDQLKKVFTDERIYDLYKIVAKGLDVIELKPLLFVSRYDSEIPPTEDGMYEDAVPLKEDPIVPARRHGLLKFMSEISKHIMSKRNLQAHEELKKEFKSPFLLKIILKGDIDRLNAQLGICLSENALLKDFIKSHNLQEEYKSRAKEEEIKYLKDQDLDEGIIQTVLKNKGWK